MIDVSWEFRLRRLATILSVAILTLALMAAITGGLLAFYYQPSAGGAYNSLETITNEVPYGWLIRSVHNIAGNGLVGLGLIQIVVMFLGEKFRRSWIAGWISNILLVLTAIGLGWTAMLLDWSQEGFWRFRIEVATIEAIPLIGPQLVAILTGGSGVSTVTVQHLYALHSYVLPLGAIALATVHLVSLLMLQQQERREKQNELLEANS
ncbi:cytochrome b N-terminal domain-containing protein [Microcoleus sp. FACHB-672]|uniref:cytochrome b N-terminal domain-containing protein n=1 Tax=Microcoleus sp. FACHB-672 TaxID=2692825 RepID=UPI00168540B0|nr:cytochrome b N-terminal domain-containing protein [Microcoleus sp. FACHB-672]MBD2043667.1 cytochrome bc complex cytochrome b subunit [Microcoleus sp. FACHB-672]